MWIARPLAVSHSLSLSLACFSLGWYEWQWGVCMETLT